MTHKETIREILKEVVLEYRSTDAPEELAIKNDTRPLEHLNEFDSICALEVTTEVISGLGYEQENMFELMCQFFEPYEPGEPLTIDDIVDRMYEWLTDKKGV